MLKDISHKNFEELLEDVKGNRIRTYILFSNKGLGKTTYMKNLSINFENTEYIDFLDVLEDFFKTQNIIELKYFQIELFFK